MLLSRAALTTSRLKARYSGSSVNVSASVAIATRRSARSTSARATLEAYAPCRKSIVTRPGEGGASGSFCEGSERLAIADEMRPKTIQWAPRLPRSCRRRSGNLSLVSEIVPTGAQLIGPLPGDLGMVLVFRWHGSMSRSSAPRR